MRDLEKYKGVIPAFYACYDENGEISPERVKDLAKYYIDKGVKGLYVNGSSGECIYQSVEERKLVLESVCEVAKGKLTIIAHVACNNTRDSMVLAEHAESIGVDAIAAIPPIYFKLPDYSIENYWNDISYAAPNTDFIIYNIPQLAGVALTESIFSVMRKNPNVIGIKNSSMPVQDIQMFKQAAGEDYIIFNGPDEQFISGMIIGAEGAIGGTYGVMPELFMKMLESLRVGDIKTARDIQNSVDLIIYKMASAHGNLYAVMKEILKENEDLDLGGVRKPLTGLIDADKVIVKEASKMIRAAKDKYLNINLLNPYKSL
ncbi:MAG: dihydrodipicolinate synthase family protein [Anaerococcus sp.]|nr:dihydrodipicolinate synthase family protein [Anaerococcus sp.]